MVQSMLGSIVAALVVGAIIFVLCVVFLFVLNRVPSSEGRLRHARVLSPLQENARVNFRLERELNRYDGHPEPAG